MRKNEVVMKIVVFDTFRQELGDKRMNGSLLTSIVLPAPDGPIIILL